MEFERQLPVDAIAGAILGALVGALFVFFEAGNGNALADIATGAVVFGSLGFVRWLNRLPVRRRVRR